MAQHERADGNGGEHGKENESAHAGSFSAGSLDGILNEGPAQEVPHLIVVAPGFKPPDRNLGEQKQRQPRSKLDDDIHAPLLKAPASRHPRSYPLDDITRVWLRSQDPEYPEHPESSSEPHGA